MDFKQTLETLNNLRPLYAGGGDDSVFSPAQKRWIQSTYKNETGNSIKECGCKNKYTDAVDELIALLTRKGTLDAEAQYKLRAGVIIWLGSECYSRHNITDAVAKEWLEIHPDGAAFFE